jgi:DNA-binding NtrC family response regulator
MRRAATSHVTVLIRGERGTGKELAARAIHRSGVRRDAPFVVVSCAAVSEDVLESELLARAPNDSGSGQPSGADAAASPGTLLLDEIDELAPALQARLTRVLQEHSSRGVEPVNGERRVARVIATTSLELKEAVAAGRFREDLFYRLNVLRIQLPPLRDRKQDIPLLLARFLEIHGPRCGGGAEGFAPEALSALMRYEWPGNVRELENAVERALAVVDAPRIPLEALPDEVRGVGAGSLSGLAQLTYHDAVELARERASREYLIALMQQFGGSVTRAAERAGMERESLHRLLKRYGLRSNEFKGSD